MEGKQKMEENKRRRQILRKFISFDQCKELEFIHKSCSTVGYRPNVFSTTLSHLIATNCSHFIIPFVSIRERLKEVLEEFFGCEFELFVEFTGLISWTRGASIGWHSDDNRPYLKQRDFAAVCYLNTYEKDFKGGLFHFQDGSPTTFVPSAGDVLMYTADTRNIHSVDEISDGERLTLTLWFSRDRSHDEDIKLISLLSQGLLHNSDNVPHSCLPLPASSNMYWFQSQQSSHSQLDFDIRWARMHGLGYTIYMSKHKSCFSDISDLLMEPLGLARGDELFDQEFVNILHALQVVQFYYWKAPELNTFAEVETSKVIRLSQSQMEEIGDLKSLFLKDHQLAEMVFSCVTRKESAQHCFTWASFSAVILAWEDYTCKLHNELITSLPCWQTHQSIFSVPFGRP